MRIPVDIYYHVPSKTKCMFKLCLNKAQLATLNEGKDLTIRGRFRLFKKREKVIFAPIFQLTENETKFLGVKIEKGGITALPRYYIAY